MGNMSTRTYTARGGDASDARRASASLKAGAKADKPKPKAAVPKPKAAAPKPKGLDGKTLDELKERAQKLKIAGCSKMRKAELIDAIRQKNQR